jgi:hypothetical protein
MCIFCVPYPTRVAYLVFVVFNILPNRILLKICLVGGPALPPRLCYFARLSICPAFPRVTRERMSLCDA